MKKIFAMAIALAVMGTDETADYTDKKDGTDEQQHQW
jgi:hypothetical protein